MANNTRDIQIRMNTVKNTSQITNAMKLVSMSKYQHYARLVDELEDFLKEMKHIKVETTEAEEMDTEHGLAICFSADLGLASLYHNSIYKQLRAAGFKNVVWIGKKLYDRVCNEADFHVLNEQMIASEKVDVNQLFADVLEWMKDYPIYIARPRLISGETIEVDWVSGDKQLVDSDFVDYYPDRESANARFFEMNLLVTLYDGLYSSKTTEHMIRRLSMDTATDNAQSLYDDLQLRYNRLRQEKITQEILELSSGMESR